MPSVGTDRSPVPGVVGRREAVTTAIMLLPVISMDGSVTYDET